MYVSHHFTLLPKPSSSLLRTNIQLTQDDAEPLETSFELNDTLFAKANIEKVDEVYLWLGVRRKEPLPSQDQCRESGAHATKILTTNHTQANVMLSYPIPEAEELLTNKLSAAQQSLRNCEEDLDFLREQVTVRVLKYKWKKPWNAFFRHDTLGRASNLCLPFSLCILIG